MTTTLKHRSSRDKMKGLLNEVDSYSHGGYLGHNVIFRHGIDENSTPIEVFDSISKSLEAMKEHSDHELRQLGLSLNPLLQGRALTIANRIPNRLFDGDTYYFNDAITEVDDNGTEQPTPITSSGLWQYRVRRYPDGSLANEDTHPPIWQKVLDIPNPDRVPFPTS
ncbi:hypothetical protein [Vibrio sp. CyArs1]|uniref:hypothetical protein n=1 Tax=Vibrio sp. CyArs1 TaxID=2682577 RepID=UPI001F0643AB|nr:hypothetical protein [Vibrio sp. CyArs1]